MMQIINNLSHKIVYNKNYYTPTFKSVGNSMININSEKTITEYLDNQAITNLALVKLENKPIKNNSEYKNNLRTMIQNNESVMLAIVLRTFTAKDLNGDEKISLSGGEKQGTLISAIDRLDEIKDLGINTLHLLPLHPPGTVKAKGTAGSIYSPDRFLEPDGSLAIDPLIIEKDDPRSPTEQFRAFIDECHKRNIKVMIDLPSCASVSWFEREPELMAFGRNGEEKTPQGWTDIRMFEPWDDETKRTLNPKLLELHKQYVDACIDLGIDGIRADVARAKPPEFWDILIPYSHKRDAEFAWLGESYTYECASPQVNMPYDRPEDTLRAGFDEYYGQYHIFYDWSTNKELIDYIKLNLNLSHRLPSGKSCIGSFTTHDDKSAMEHGGEIYSNLTTIIQSTIPMCNPYFVDGFQFGDRYDYGYKDEMSEESFTDNYKLECHEHQLDIFNLSRKPDGEFHDIGRVMKEALKMREENKELFSDRKSVFIELDKIGDKKDQIITYARHNNGRTALIIANKNPNRRLTGTILVPGLNENQELKNIAPIYGEERSKFQIAKNEVRVDLAPGGAYVFEINTPNIIKDRKGHAFRQKI
ncbi:hypothetical protein J6R97_04930 [bacterium]|nr:hypothetical protein [bacterium]